MKKRVMVVDDSRFVLEEMKLMLAETDFEIIGYCMSGEEALPAYKELIPDIVTMDIILPGIDGLEASEQLLGEFPDAKIVVVSSLAYDETEAKAKELGIKAFVFKPFERESLIEALSVYN